MTSTVRVVQPGAPDQACLDRLLGEPGLPVEHVSAPSILVDGRYHPAACQWLRRKEMILMVVGAGGLVLGLVRGSSTSVKREVSSDGRAVVEDRRTTRL